MTRDDLYQTDALHRSLAGRVARLAMVLVVAAPALATTASADGLSTDDLVPTMRGRSTTIETWPSLDHHYRNDMVEPDWRMYQNSPYGYERSPYGQGRQDRGRSSDMGPYGRGPHSPGPYGPADARLREADRIRSSLDRADRDYRCDQWHNGCAPAERWWTR